MRIEKHNGHGLQLCVGMSVDEALRLIEDLTRAVRKTTTTKVNHYTHVDVMFEDDNNRWEPTSFDLTVKSDGSVEDCEPA